MHTINFSLPKVFAVLFLLSGIWIGLYSTQNPQINEQLTQQETLTPEK
jgi:uncharacterized membrane protein